MNKTAFFYDLQTGLFTGQSLGGPADWVDANLPDNAGAWPEPVDHLSQRLDLATRLIVDYQPPAPAADEFTQWTWDTELKRWRPSPTLAGKWRVVRNERGRRLSACDWIVTKSAETGVAVPAAWQTYRQALRDVPETNADPTNITWPTPPA
jgi:hypothetical protein